MMNAFRTILSFCLCKYLFHNFVLFSNESRQQEKHNAQLQSEIMIYRQTNRYYSSKISINMCTNVCIQLAEQDHTGKNFPL